MKIETLKDRISKSEKKLIKLNGTLERHQKALSKKSKSLTNKGIDLDNYNKFDKSIIDNDTYWELCDYEGKLEDIENNNKKILEVTKKLNTYKEQLEDQLAKNTEMKNTIPECLNIFLENWKQKCMEFYINLANKYIELKFKEYEVTKDNLKFTNRYSDEEIEKILLQEANNATCKNAKNYIQYEYFKQFKNLIFSSNLQIIEKIVQCDTINKDRLNKILDKDVKNKKETFIKRIYEVIGNIVDLSDLQIGDNGEINGIAKGVKANAKVETISAGGYNVQCYHFRVLVNTVK